MLWAFPTYLEVSTACVLEEFGPRAKDATMKLPGAIAAFDIEIRIVAGIEQPIAPISI